MKLFLGEYDHSLDDRGRITLPRKVRQELEQREVILSKGFDTCIFGYDKKSWEEEAGKQLAHSIIDKEARNIRRYLFAGALKVEIDKLGRIVLPAHLKEYAGITKEVIVIGAGDHFEIWDRLRWDKANRELEGSIL